MKKIIFILTIAVMFQMCKTKPIPERNIDVIEIDVNSSKDNINIDYLVDTVSHIKLETNDYCLLQRIKKMVITEEELIILDDFVYIFDLKGKFKLKIGNRGKGPGELLSSNDFLFDIKNENIEIYDFTQNKVCVFTKKGKYLTEFRFPFGRINRYEKKENGDYIIWRTLGNLGDENAFIGHKIYIGNLNDGFVKFKPCYKFDGNLRLNQSFSNCGDNYFFWEMLNDTIFEINSKNEFYKKFYIDFGKNKTPDDIRRIPLNDRIFKIKDNYKIATAINNFYCTPQFLYFNFLHNKKQYNVFITDNGTTRIGNQIIYNQVHYSALTYFDGNNKVASIEYPDKASNSFKKYLKGNFNISDNPVIAVFSLKK